MNTLILLIVFLPMLFAFACYLAGTISAKLRSILACLAGAGEFVLALCLFSCAGGSFELENICSFGLGFELDGFRKVYAVVISLMWMMTLLLSDEYFAHYSNRGRYYFFNLMTLGATMGVFLARDLFTAFIFFEIMSFTSFVWVIQEETEGAVKAAKTYLAVAVIGGLAALMGLFLLDHCLGTTEISLLYDLAANYSSKGVLYTAGICVLVGFGGKAGMFPLHIWLPKAHPVAPAPASALLSGVLTKSGIWGILAISSSIFRYDPAWGCIILLLGTVTMVLGAVLALFSIDLKRTLACSSMSQIGFILVGIGMMGLLGHENALAARGTLLHMVNHSVFKLILFMCAGVVFMNLHELDLNKIRGFGHGKPVLMFAFLMGALGISGVPLWSGYVSKTLLHESIVEFGGGAFIHCVEWLFLISGGITFAYMLKLFTAIFIENNTDADVKQRSGSKYMKLPSALAVAVSALIPPVLGFTASASMDRIADLGTDFLHGGELEHQVHYLSLANLKGAAISLAIGAALYFLVVRKFLMKDGRYIDRWPSWLDLEELLYRPLVLRFLPFVFGSVSSFLSSLPEISLFSRHIPKAAGILAHAVSDTPDAIVFLARKTVLKESRVRDTDKISDNLAYRVGSRVDSRLIHRGKQNADEHKYAILLYRLYISSSDAMQRITGSLSFGLFMLCLAICLIFVYIMVIL